MGESGRLSTLQLHLIRHAHAGHRSEWDGDDAARPLEARGWRESEAIARDLADAGIDLIWSSPYTRCVQTMEPLAAHLGLEIVARRELHEGAWGSDTLDALLKQAGKGHTVAACSHGDVIPAVVAEALKRGATLDGPASVQKGARFVATVKKGRISKLVHVHRPDV